MENLSLEALGLSEMSRTEVSEIDGGWWQIIVAGILVDAMLNPGDALSEMQAGYAAAMQ